MNAKFAISMLAGLLAMTTLSAGCLDAPQTQVDGYVAKVTPPSLIKSDDLFFKDTKKDGSIVFRDLAGADKTYYLPYGGSTALVGALELYRDEGAFVRVTLDRYDKYVERVEKITKDGVAQFLPAPYGVKYFILEVGPNGCADGEPKFYSPPDGVEWYVNTGERSGVVMNWEIPYVGAGDKEIVTEGEWWPTAITSEAFNFCFYTEDGETVTIALALPPPQKG